MSRDDEQGLRRLLGQRGADQARGRAPGAVHGGAAPLFQGGQHGLKLSNFAQQLGDVGELC